MGGDKVPTIFPDPELRGREAALKLMIQQFKDLEMYARDSRQALEEEYRRIIAMKTLQEVEGVSARARVEDAASG